MSPDASLTAHRLVPARDDEAGPGAFVAVVGPSGAGKDTLLRLAAQRLESEPRIVFSRRVVTREAVASVEDHDVMTAERFERERRDGAFCLSWQAHQLSYGLPASLEADLSAGRLVVANVSRRVLPEAAARFDRLVVVEITAPQAILVQRIVSRGRETAAEIAARMARRVELKVPAGTRSLHRIRNDGTPETGAAGLQDILAGLLR